MTEDELWDEVGTDKKSRFPGDAGYNLAHLQWLL